MTLKGRRLNGRGRGRGGGPPAITIRRSVTLRDSLTTEGRRNSQAAKSDVKHHGRRSLVDNLHCCGMATADRCAGPS